MNLGQLIDITLGQLSFFSLLQTAISTQHGGQARLSKGYNCTNAD
jgi:hypothetical protein